MACWRAMDLNQVTLPATDLDRSLAFYGALGLQVIVDARPRYLRFESPGTHATLSLHQVAEVGGSPIVVYFECEELDARVAALQAAGLSFEAGPIDQPWLWREAYLRDPDGNRLCLYHAGGNRKEPPWRVGRG